MEVLSKWSHNKRDKEQGSTQSESKLNPVGKAKKKSQIKITRSDKNPYTGYTYQIWNGNIELHIIQNSKPLTDMAKPGFFMFKETCNPHLCKTDFKEVSHITTLLSSNKNKKNVEMIKWIYDYHLWLPSRLLLWYFLQHSKSGRCSTQHQISGHWWWWGLLSGKLKIGWMTEGAGMRKADSKRCTGKKVGKK